MRASKTPQTNTKADHPDKSTKGVPSVQFADNRPVAAAQRRMRETADRSSDRKLADTAVNTAGAPVQRAILMPDGNPNSFLPTSQRIQNDLILAAANDDERGKIAGFLGKASVINALEVLRETDTAFNFSAVLAAFRARCAGVVNDQTAITLATALGRATLAQADLSAEDNEILKQNLHLSPHITTDDDRLARRQAEERAAAITGLRTHFGAYDPIFKHIFEGEFSKDKKPVPTGYHYEGRSATHRTYGAATGLPFNTYQQSVRAAVPPGGKAPVSKPNQSTFFPAAASVDDIKLAVVSGDRRMDKTVQYPEAMEGMPLTKMGGTIYPNTGPTKEAE